MECQGIVLLEKIHGTGQVSMLHIPDLIEAPNLRAIILMVY